MIKKLYLLFLILLLSLVSVYSNTQSVTQCPGAVSDNTQYLLDENFNFNINNCFDLTSSTNVTINGQNHLFDLSTLKPYIQLSNSNDVTFKNFQSTNGHFYLRLNNINSNINIDNIYLEQTENLGTRSAVLLFYMISGSTDGITISNSKVVNMDTLSQNGGDNAHAIFSMQSGTQKTDLDNLVISNSEFLNLELIYNDFNILNLGSINMFDSIITHVNQDLFLRNVNLENACSNYVFNNVMTSIWNLNDNDMDGLSDNSQSYVFDSCTLFNGNQITRSEGFSPYSEGKVYFNSPVYFVPSNTINKDFVLTNRLILDGAKIINLEGTQNSELDLSLGLNGNILTLTNVRAIRTGTSNSINGGKDLTMKPNIATSGTISNVYTDVYNSNWHLIEYDNDLSINNINFDLNAIDNYGLLRKRESGTDGINFEFTNNVFDLNFNPASQDIPMFVIGSFSKFMNNVFELSSTQNISLIQGGLSSTVSGGHIIQDNTFIGGGDIFSKMSDTLLESNRFTTQIIHNEFLQSGNGLYALPVNPTEQNFNTLINPSLNATYFYQTTCTNYQFNLGNYYQDWDDSNFYNDSNGDGIHDGFNGFDYIERGADFLNNPIRDFRSVTPYPYNFLSNIGNAEATFDTCQSFNFNIIEPQEQNYSSGFELTSNWEFISIAYDDMICFETLNGFTSVYQNVESGDNKGQTYDTTDGKGFFQVKCCDNELCTNIVQESEVIEFNIGDGTLGNLIVQGSITPVEVPGCTDPLANNYNPSATQDNGSCTYDNGGGDNGGGDNGGGTGSLTGGSLLDIDSPSNSADNVISTIDNVSSFILYIIVPLFIILMIFGVGVFLVRLW